MRIVRMENKGKRNSSLGGLFLAEQIIKQTFSKDKISDKLPKNLINPRVSSSFDKFKALMYGFISGCECLEDMDRFFADGLSSELVPLNSSQTYGDYLRSFSLDNIKVLNKNLISTALGIRKRVTGEIKEITIDIDSTFHDQHGKKIEGYAKNYQDRMGLDSIMAFDEMGFQYWDDVRAGNTYSSNGASEIIHEIFKQIPRRRGHIKVARYFRGDSAFCNKDIFHACFVEGVKFVVAMKENMYMQYLSKISKWHKADKDIHFRDGRSCEIGDTIGYSDLWHEPLRIVAMRARRDDNTIFDIDGYDYVVFVTNIGNHEKGNNSIVKFYRKRGNAENFIREQKYGFDLKHFPCKMLNANKAYGIIAAYSYNIMRYMGYLINPKKVPFSKRIRFLMVNLPCEVIKHAGYIIVRFHNAIYEEVMNYQNKIINTKFFTRSLTT